MYQPLYPFSKTHNITLWQRLRKPKPLFAMSISTMLAAPKSALKTLGLSTSKNIHYQLSPSTLTEQAVQRGEGVLNDTGALLINTGKFTGRSPKDKFTVKDTLTENTVHWNDFNIPFEEKNFFSLKEKKHFLLMMWNIFQIVPFQKKEGIIYFIIFALYILRC